MTEDCTLTASVHREDVAICVPDNVVLMDLSDSCSCAFSRVHRPPNLDRIFSIWFFATSARVHPWTSALNAIEKEHRRALRVALAYSVACRSPSRA